MISQPAKDPKNLRIEDTVITTKSRTHSLLVCSSKSGNLTLIGNVALKNIHIEAEESASAMIGNLEGRMEIVNASVSDSTITIDASDASSAWKKINAGFILQRATNECADGIDFEQLITEKELNPDDTIVDFPKRNISNVRAITFDLYKALELHKTSPSVSITDTSFSNSTISVYAPDQQANAGLVAGTMPKNSQVVGTMAEKSTVSVTSGNKAACAGAAVGSALFVEQTIGGSIETGMLSIRDTTAHDCHISARGKNTTYTYIRDLNIYTGAGIAIGCAAGDVEISDTSVAESHVSAVGNYSSAAIAAGNIRTGVYNDIWVRDNQHNCGLGYLKSGRVSGKIERTNALNTTVHSSGKNSSVGIGAGRALDDHPDDWLPSTGQFAIKDTSAESCQLTAQGDYAHAGIGAGLGDSAEIINTTAVDTKLTTNGREAHIGIGAGFVNKATVKHSRAETSSMLAHGVDAKVGIGVGSQVDNTSHVEHSSAISSLLAAEQGLVCLSKNDTVINTTILSMQKPEETLQADLRNSSSDYCYNFQFPTTTTVPATNTTPVTLNSTIAAGTATTASASVLPYMAAAGAGVGILALYCTYQWVNGYREGQRGTELLQRPFTNPRDWFASVCQNTGNRQVLNHSQNNGTGAQESTVDDIINTSQSGVTVLARGTSTLQPTTGIVDSQPQSAATTIQVELHNPEDNSFSQALVPYGSSYQQQPANQLVPIYAGAGPNCPATVHIGNSMVVLNTPEQLSIVVDQLVKSSRDDDSQFSSYPGSSRRTSQFG